MNDTQKKILVCVAVAIVATLLFPPFHTVHNNGITINIGYGFLFDPPTGAYGRTGSVTIGVLFMEWIAIVVVGGILWWMTKSK